MASPHPTQATGGFGVDLRSLQAVATRRAFAAGQVIFSAGDTGDGFYVVLSGWVRIAAAIGPGESRVLATIGPGDFFGEMAVVDDAPRSATATAAVRTRTLFVERATLLELLSRQPDLALRILRQFSVRMRNLNQKYVEEIRQAERLAAIGRFTTTIVHDFKAPLAIISLATDLACSRHIRWAQRRELRTMVSRQTARMKSMMQELIDFTQPGGEKPKLRPVQFASFLEALVEEVTAELAQRGVQLMVAEPVPRVTMRLDSQRLARLFYNLFSNAADEMETGGTISLSCRKTDGELQIDIQDTGPGIPPEFAASLFKPFATHGKPHGTGLGLTICRRIAEDHGGRIWATSTPGHGATFSFTLPLARR